MSHAPRAHVKLDGLTTEQLRDLCIACSQNRDAAREHLRNPGTGEPAWAPIVHCDGSYWTAYVPPFSIFAAMSVLNNIDTKER